VTGRMRVASPPASSASGGSSVILSALGTRQYSGCSSKIVLTAILFRGVQTHLSQYTSKYLAEVAEIAARLDQKQIDEMIRILRETRENNGRVFFLGVGGGAGHASHAVNDFRKIAGIECYTPTDNVSELTARINDDGWDTCYARWLAGSRLRNSDAVFVFSVGGGNLEKNISANLVEALRFAQKQGAKIVGVVGRDGGYTAQVANACVVVPTLSADSVTPHAEAFQAVVWHLMVSHPDLRQNEMKWEVSA
jgi:D-sedoheptulose 7-phosphate isomerase